MAHFAHLAHLAITDKIALAALLVSILAAIAAFAAVWFAYKSPTREDLQRVEENTANAAAGLERVHTHIASVNSQLSEQRSRDNLISHAQHVSIRVSGSGYMNRPLPVSLTLDEDDITIDRIEMFDQVGMRFGEAKCNRVEPLTFCSELVADEAQKWYGNGIPNRIANERLLTLRAHILIAGNPAYRDFAVLLTLGQRPGKDPTRPMARVLILEGSC
jgi:hypothetical protein